MNGASCAATAGDGVTGDRHALRRGEEGNHVRDLVGVDDPADDVPRERAAVSSVMRSVRVAPGCTTVTLIPWGPNSSARFFVIAATETLRIEPRTDPD